MMKWIARGLIILGLFIFSAIYGKVVTEELRYQFNKLAGVKYSLDVHPQFPEEGFRYVAPVDKNFGIVVTKINLNVSVFPNIDSNNPDEYLTILKKGVAQAKGSALPGEFGNIFIFGHSTDAFYNVSKYNAVFYLIGKLENDDQIDIYFQNRRYKYRVIDKIVVAPEMIVDSMKQYQQGGEYLTLQTCYPPGTTLKRLLVTAKRID